MRREVKYKIKGMNKDSSFSAFSPEFSFENRNIRITTLEGNTTLSIVNEKGTKPLAYICTDYEGNLVDLNPNIIGYSVVGDVLVLFTHTENLKNKDAIYKAEFTGNRLSIIRLYSGNLGFRLKYPIETLGIYENENNIKVYWVDGINQPRVINIADDPSNYTENSFDFVPKVGNIGESNFIVTKKYSIGTFPSGVIQYCYTYYNKNGQETNIIDVSPLFYTTNSDRGGNPEETVTNSFNIEIQAPNREFEFVRIYSILRTSLNATPLCKVVADIEITEWDVNIIDTGNLGYTIDPTDLLYVGGEVITAGTLNQKDNTLFLGNISVEKLDAGSINVSNSDGDVLGSVENLLQEGASQGYLSFADVGKVLINNGSTGEYPYRNQLDGNSREFKIFKRGETYRCGLQFQHATGKWSSPIWLKDIKNDIKPSGYYDTEAPIEVTTGKPVFLLNHEETINSLIEQGYKAVRPVVVYPTDADRDIICQGVINPTVFNVKDRQDGTTHAQASWFFRPNLPFNAIDETSGYGGSLRVTDFEDFNGEQMVFSGNSMGGVLATEDYYDLEDDSPQHITFKYKSKDAWTEFRHFYYIPNNKDTRAEIQCIEQYPVTKIKIPPSSSPSGHYSVKQIPYKKNDDNVTDFPEMYVIDSSIVTLNSPEVELNRISENILSSCTIKYVGIIPITGNLQDIDVLSSTPTNTGTYKIIEGVHVEARIAEGFLKSRITQTPNISVLGGRRKLAAPLWEDYIFDGGTEERSSPRNFITYPWHRNGSLNNQRDAGDSVLTASLKEQKRSTLFYSTNSIYLDGTTTLYTPSSINLANSSYFPIKYLDNTPNNITDYTEGFYKKDVDTIILPKFVQEFPEDAKEDTIIIDKDRGYKIVFLPDLSEEVGWNTANALRHDRYGKNYTYGHISKYGIDLVNIKYKSTPHIVLDHGIVNNPNDQKEHLCKYTSPTLNNLNTDYNRLLDIGYLTRNVTSQYNEDNDYLKEASEEGNPLRYSWLWLAELVREIPADIKFGGTSKQAIENNQWVVAGDSYPLERKDNEGRYIINTPNIVWREGDHYYQRYDCLKTYPYTMEDTNSVVEMLSFMCETRVNLDGRYDKNRGKRNNLVMTPNNFNLMNPVYDQQNNFFNYRVAEKQYQEINDYLNAITWSKTKTFGEKVDTWTNITLASILELDGNKGRVESIKRLNNDLIAFQERGISQILYNDNVQISTQSGVPVEIANSGKVQGKRYLSSYVGCNNKWSICESPAGLYFIDDNTKGIYLFNGNLTNLSDKLGFSSWAKENLKENNFISYYDPIESEVLFLNDIECLTYSERLGTFTSFYDYTSDTIPINMGNRTLLVGDPLGESKLKFYEYHAGKYNDFYGNFKNFSVELIVNPEPTKDKIFNTVEFRADAFDAEGKYLGDVKPFSTIQVKNEYQDTGDILLDDINLRKKFRIWRHTIQRDKANKRDRIRNPWATITLKNENPEDNKVVLHDVVISYFD